MRLTREIESFCQDKTTPFLLIDLKKVRENYRTLHAQLPEVEVFYVIKANDHPTICSALFEEGASFEIASLHEAQSLQKLGIPTSKMFCFNTIKSREFLRWMSANKLEVMVFDSYEELDKIAANAPGSKVVIRILVPEEGSFFPLSSKFGVDPSEAMALFQHATKLGLVPYGITCHVGSQCTNSQNWVGALKLYEQVFTDYKSETGKNLTLMSLGGGIPIEYRSPIPALSAITADISEAVSHAKHLFPKTRFTIEPGRGIIANAGILVMTIEGKAKRKECTWLYADAGVFNGFMEIFGDFSFNFVSPKGPGKIVTSIAGPTCDSYDIIAKNIPLPELEIGERLYALDLGAYSTSASCTFNGFEIPKTYFLHE